MKLVIPEYVKKIIKTLNKNGFQAFVVGGAVRDAMLGYTPDDWDVTTNAVAEQTKNCFEHHFDTGIKHGTITVLMDKKPVEVTTYRVDGKYTDNRRPENVSFTSNIADDLKRRDFTINAMAYNEKDGLLDLYGGAEDLKNKIVRCVGDADVRFKEDALRIMRGIRFAIKLGFDIEEKTFDAIKKNRELLKNISVERIQTELVKMLEVDDDLHLLFESGVANIIMPEIEYNKISLNVPCDIDLKLSALLYNIVDVRGFLNRLRFDNNTKNNVIKIIQCAKEDINCTNYGIKKLLNKYGAHLFEKSLFIMYCYGRDVSDIKDIFNKVKNEPYLISHLDITGTDIKKLGIIDRKIGTVMNELLDKVMQNPVLNSKQMLLDIAISYKL